MAERNIVPNLEAKATDGNPVFTPRQWLERFRQFGKQNRYHTIAEWRRNNQLGRKKTSNIRRLHMGCGTRSTLSNNQGRI